MTVVTLAPVVTCTDAACLNATSHREACECTQCFGDDHGHAWKATRQAARDRITARAARLGDPFLGAATHDVDEPMPVRRRPIDPEDTF